MARYIVTSGSKFEPFTYEELAAPIQQFTDAQNAAAEKYDELNMQTQALANYIDKTNDPDAWHLYDTYMTQLQALQNNLWEKGYNAGTVRDISTARGLYARDISRISEAVKARQTQAQKQADMLMKDPTLFVSYKPGEKSLDEYLHNDNYGMDWRSYSGNTLAAEGKAIGATLAERLLTDPEYRRLAETDGAYFEQLLTYGVDADTINNVIESYLAGNRPSATVNQILYDMIDQVYTASGMDQWADDNTKRAAVNRIAEGIHSATGKSSVDTLANPWAKPSGNGNGSGSGSTDADKDYDPVNVLINKVNKEGAQTQVETDKNFGPLEGGTKPIVARDENGEEVGLEVSTAEDLTGVVFHPEYVDAIIDKYRIDPRGIRGHVNQWRQEGRRLMKDDQGNIHQYDLRTGVLNKVEAKKLGMTNIPDNPMAVQRFNSATNKWELDKNITLEVNEARYRYQQDKKQFKKDNPHPHLKKNAMTVGEERRIRKARDLDLNTNWRSLQYIDRPGAMNQQTVGITLIGDSDNEKEIGNTIQNAMIHSYDENMQNSNQSQYVFYPVDKKTGRIMPKGETDIRKVFPSGDDGQLKNFNHFTLSVRPEELANGFLRFTTGGNQWAVRVEMLGENINEAMNADVVMQDTEGNALRDANGNIVTRNLRQLVDIASAPLFRQNEIYNRWSDEDIEFNTLLAYNLLGEEYPAEVTKDSKGNRSMHLYNLYEITKDPKKKRDLDKAIRKVVTMVLAQPIDYIRNHVMRNPGGSSETSVRTVN